MDTKEALADKLNQDYRLLSEVGSKFDQFETVETIEGDEGRWTKAMTVITRDNDSGRTFQWTYESALTEYQDDDRFDETVQEVKAMEKTITVIDWLPV